MSRYRVPTGNPDQHYYGWTPSKPDQRDRKFAPLQPVLDAMPPQVDLSAPALPSPFEPAWNQQTLGSCGPNTACEDIVFSVLKQDLLPNAPMPSRLFVYYNTRRIMGTINEDSGVDNRSLLKALNQFGWCDESLWPYDISKFRQQPSPLCYTQGADRKIVSYAAVPQDLQTMKACLAGGDTFIFGFSVYESFESQVVTQTGVVPMPRHMERVLGGHDVLCVGYSDQGDPANGWPAQTFKFKNHWGKWGWRGLGYCFIPYAFCINPNYSSDFWTVQHSALPIPTPPVPPNPPVPPSPPAPPSLADMSLALDAAKKTASVFVPADWTVLRVKPSVSGEFSMDKFDQLAAELQALLPVSGPATFGAAGGVLGAVMALIAALQTKDPTVIGNALYDLLGILLGKTSSTSTVVVQGHLQALNIDLGKLISVLVQILPLILGA